ncbi:hypothetical protein GCM10027566_20220 [Arachidicoccus ginsenosidivorans]|jgi:hypothetical protein|uniref:Uncharacterized protein n=1 Tax=Arachidicoccus ginsenosidivorans TaxID=496057 RepID=A0A5B8VLU1_9BACT|nr:hypothetical protein [Arachidicoccus ginsenosidivorans]QEC72021.1 hypothetical protein FSB73_10445 [Arachidicoccus ginsenosidivorans]
MMNVADQSKDFVSVFSNDYSMNEMNNKLKINRQAAHELIIELNNLETSPLKNRRKAIKGYWMTSKMALNRVRGGMSPLLINRPKSRITHQIAPMRHPNQYEWPVI